MTKEEVTQVIDKIKFFRPIFGTGIPGNWYERIIRDFYPNLKDYDLEDVLENTEMILSETNQNYIPNSSELVRNLPTIEQKKHKGEFKITCQHCGRYLDPTEIRSHEDRCSSVKYLEKLSKWCFNHGLSNQTKSVYYKMSQEEFDDKYYEILEKCLPHLKVKGRTLDVRGIENVLSTRNGGKAKWSARQVLGWE